MTMEVFGTLVGAAIQGQIVASAHTLHCPPHNVTAGYRGNGSGAEVVRKLVRSQDYLSHSVSVPREPRCIEVGQRKITHRGGGGAGGGAE